MANVPFGDVGGMAAGPPSTWASDMGSAQDVYIGQRLGYRDSSAEGDAAFGAISARYVMQLLFRTWLFATILWIVPAIFLYLVAGSEETDQFGNTTSSGPSPVLTILLWFGCFVVAGLIRERQWASQWSIVLDDAAPAAPSAYGRVIEVIRARQLPIYVKTRAITSDFGGETRWYLVLTFREYSAYVGVFGFGTSLSISWSMWRDQRTLGVFWSFISQTLSGSSHIDQIIRTDPARAMRDAVHNAVREGLDAAIEGDGPDLQQVLGSSVPHLEPAIAGRGAEPPAVSTWTPPGDAAHTAGGAYADPGRPAGPPSATWTPPSEPSDPPSTSY